MLSAISPLRLRRNVLALVPALGCAVCLFGYSKSGTNYTTDGSQSDVNAAIANASTGDTVNIPSGSFTWGASGAQVTVSKAITLAGAGTANTTIVLSPSGPTYASGVIIISAAAVVRDFSVTGTASAPVTAIGAFADGWRVTNIAYTGSTSDAYFMYTAGYGVIDSCNIVGNSGSAELIFGRGPTDSWQTPSSMGTANATYIEDCTFGGQGYVCDANSNARYVVRFCTITGGNKVDGHGLASNTPARSVRHMEVYDNHWSAPVGSGYYQVIEIRGGTGMVFDNVADNTSSSWLELDEYGALAQWPNFNNVYQTPANYPIADQVGVGQDPKAGGSEPMYLVHNLIGGSNWGVTWVAVAAGAITQYGTTFTMQDIIKPDRDCFLYTTSFTGTSGVGRGTKASMLAIHPTLTGVGYWVTDEGTWNTKVTGTSGQLYVWNGSAWVLKYTPYAYPHPLRTGVTPPVVAPSGATVTISVP